MFGKSDWLDGKMSLVDYGARSVPNLYLEAPLQTYNKTKGTGAWNAAHFNNATYDKLSKEFVAAVDLSEQRKIAGQIEKLLLDETPIIFPYFYDYLCATAKNVKGVYPTGQAQLFLWNATKSSNPPPLGRLCDAGPAVKRPVGRKEPGAIFLVRQGHRLLTRHRYESGFHGQYLQCTGRYRVQFSLLEVQNLWHLEVTEGTSSHRGAAGVGRRP